MLGQIGTVELLGIMLLLTGTVVGLALLLGILAVCQAVFAARRRKEADVLPGMVQDLLNRLMATDWPGYVGYMKSDPRFILPSEQRAPKLAAPPPPEPSVVPRAQPAETVRPPEAMSLVEEEDVEESVAKAVIGIR